MTELVIIELALLAFAGWAGLFFVCPSVNRSLFRYELWHLRDDIEDDLLARRIPRDPAQAAVDLVEQTIRAAGWLTPIRWRLMPSPSPAMAQEVAAEMRSSLDALDPEARRRWLDHMQRYADLVSKRVWSSKIPRRAVVQLAAPGPAQEILVSFLSVHSVQIRAYRDDRPLYVYQG